MNISHIKKSELDRLINEGVEERRRKNFLKRQIASQRTKEWKKRDKLGLIKDEARKPHWLGPSAGELESKGDK